MTKQKWDRTDRNLQMRFEKKQLPFMRSVKESWLRYRTDENSLFLSKKILESVPFRSCSVALMHLYGQEYM